MLGQAEYDMTEVVSRGCGSACGWTLAVTLIFFLFAVSMFAPTPLT